LTKIRTHTFTVCVLILAWYSDGGNAKCELQKSYGRIEWKVCGEGCVFRHGKRILRQSGFDSFEPLARCITVVFFEHFEEVGGVVKAAHEGCFFAVVAFIDQAFCVIQADFCEVSIDGLSGLLFEFFAQIAAIKVEALGELVDRDILHIALQNMIGNGADQVRSVGLRLDQFGVEKEQIADNEIWKRGRCVSDIVKTGKTAFRHGEHGRKGGKMRGELAVKIYPGVFPGIFRIGVVADGLSGDDDKGLSCLQLINLASAAECAFSFADIVDHGGIKSGAQVEMHIIRIAGGFSGRDGVEFFQAEVEVNLYFRDHDTPPFR